MRRIRTIAVTGLGLMGGSLAAACRRTWPEARVLGVSRSAAARRTARRKGWIHAGYARLAEAAAEADLIVLCTPVRTFGPQLREADAAARPGTLVTDVGSVKEDVLREVRAAKLRRLHFVGAHPLVGSHRRGVEAAREDLYKGGLAFLIPPPGGWTPAYRAIRSFWKKLGLDLVETTAREHDRIVAGISHLPHAAAVCLVLAAGKKGLKYAGTGFRDTTRVAAGDASIWTPIFLANKGAILPVLRDFERILAGLRESIRKGDGRGIRRVLRKAALRRREI